MKYMSSEALWVYLCIAIIALALPLAVIADDIANNLDNSVDTTVEIMPLVAGGSSGTAKLVVVPTGGDDKPGCNLTGQTILTVSILSSNPNVATVTPNTFTFSSCGAEAILTIQPLGIGTSTISLAQVTNSTGGTFNLLPATFDVNVTAPTPNNPPAIEVVGVIMGANYEFGACPLLLAL